MHQSALTTFLLLLPCCIHGAVPSYLKTRSRTADFVRQPATFDDVLTVSASSEDTYHPMKDTVFPGVNDLLQAEEALLPSKAAFEADAGLADDPQTLASMYTQYRDQDEDDVEYYQIDEDNEVFPGESKGKWFFEADPSDPRPAAEVEADIDWDEWFDYMREDWDEYVERFGEPVMMPTGDRLFGLGEGVGRLVWVPMAPMEEEDDDEDGAWDDSLWEEFEQAWQDMQQAP